MKQRKIEIAETIIRLGREMNNQHKETVNEFLLKCIRQNDEELQDKKRVKELEELIFQEWVDKYFCDDEELDETK